MQSQQNGKFNAKQINVLMLQEGARAAFYKFQNAINAYFGQQIQVIYTYIDPNSGKITLTALDNTEQHLSINEHIGYVEYNLKKIYNIIVAENYDSTLLDAAQQSIYARWRIAKLKMPHRTRFLPILWKEDNGKWSGVTVNNLGTISEAYVNFYVNKYQQFTQNLEHNVKDFIMNEQYGARAVDNASGFLIGDISYGNGKLQLAVKKQSAAPMNMKKVYQYTKEIIDKFDPQLLWNRFVDEEKRTNNQVIMDGLKKYTQEAIDNLCAEIGNNL